MLKHQCDLLRAELETTRRDLRRAHKTIAGMVVMYRDSTKELAALKLEHGRLRWRLSEFYRADAERGAAKMGYAYGDYSNRSEP
jgi:regulator of replication initiation timing